MDKLFDKLSSYNLFNYLLPGLVFGWFLVELELFIFPTDNVLAILVAAYAFGLVVSRIGSLVIEPVIKYFKLVKFSDYADYVKACDQDKKIEILVEQANLYRTLIAGFVLVLLAYPVAYIASILGLSAHVRSAILFICGFLMFVWSYKKQSDYISKRVNARKG